MTTPRTLELQEERIVSLEWQLIEKQSQIDIIKEENSSLHRMLKTAFDAAESSRLLRVKLNELMSAIKGDRNFCDRLL
jgi:hypothetical protein